METINYLTSIINLLQKTPKHRKPSTPKDSDRNSRSVKPELETPKRSSNSTTFWTALKALRSRPSVNARQTPTGNISSNSYPR